MIIRNAREYAADKEYIVYNVVDGENWFFAAWNDLDRATAQAAEFGCYVAETADCDLEIWE